MFRPRGGMVDTGDLKSPPLIAGAGSTPVPSNKIPSLRWVFFCLKASQKFGLRREDQEGLVSYTEKSYN